MCLAPRALVHASLGQRPREKFPKMSAESANQGYGQLAAERRNKGGLRDCKIIADEHAQVNRAVSVTEFFLQGSWGRCPRLI